MLLNNKVTIVTGGASGIGEALATFAKEEAAVVVQTLAWQGRNGCCGHKR